MHQKVSKSSLKADISKRLHEYGSQSTIHGIGYILNSGLSTLDRLFWFLIFVGAAYTAKIIIGKSFYSWQDSLVITSLKDIDKSVAGMDFPAVTICPNGLHFNFAEAALIKEYNIWRLNKTQSILNENDELSLIRQYLSEKFQFNDDTKINIIEILDALTALDDQSLSANIIRKTSFAYSKQTDKEKNLDRKLQVYYGL